MNILWTAPQKPPEIDWGKIFFPKDGYNHYDAWVVNPLLPVRGVDMLRFPKLKVVATPSTGTNHIAMGFCKKHGIDVLCLLDDRRALEEIRASSEFAFLLILAALRNFERALTEVRQGRWLEHRNLLRGQELYGKTVGAIGKGRIGTNVLKWCHAFGAKIFWHDPRVPYSKPLEWIFKNCDIVLVSCTLSDETRGMIRGEHIEMMKKDGILVNVARGEIIDEPSVAAALIRRPSVRVATDVLGGEVSGRHLASPLLKMPNRVIVTPHIAGATIESEEKAANIVVGLLHKWAQAHA